MNACYRGVNIYSLAIAFSIYDSLICRYGGHLKTESLAEISDTDIVSECTVKDLIDAFNRVSSWVQ